MPRDFFSDYDQLGEVNLPSGHTFDNTMASIPGGYHYDRIQQTLFAHVTEDEKDILEGIGSHVWPLIAFIYESNQIRLYTLILNKYEYTSPLALCFERIQLTLRDLILADGGTTGDKLLRLLRQSQPPLIHDKNCVDLLTSRVSRQLNLVTNDMYTNFLTRHTFALPPPPDTDLYRVFFDPSRCEQMEEVVEHNLGTCYAQYLAAQALTLKMNNHILLKCQERIPSLDCAPMDFSEDLAIL